MRWFIHRGRAYGATVRAVRQPVFLDPSGRRWKRIRAAGLVLLAAFVALVAVAVPQIVAPPALEGAPIPNGPTVLEVGNPPVVGVGPLVRVVRLLRVDGNIYGQDPFDGQVVTQLRAEDAEAAGSATYVLQKYGYSETTHKTISLTFDDGPDPCTHPGCWISSVSTRFPRTSS